MLTLLANKFLQCVWQVTSSRSVALHLVVVDYESDLYFQNSLCQGHTYYPSLHHHFKASSIMCDIY